MDRIGRKGGSRTRRMGKGEGRGEKQKNKKMGEIKKMIKGKFQTQKTISRIQQKIAKQRRRKNKKKIKKNHQANVNVKGRWHKLV